MYWDKKERRLHPRGDFPTKIFVYSKERNRVFSAYTRNISAKGICVFLQTQFIVQELVDIEIHFDDETLMCRGKIVWVKEENLDKASGFLTGIEIEDCHTIS